jgi:glutamine amidotransferase
MVVIIDYKVGNLGSIQNMLKKIHTEFLVSSDPALILSADKLILPGVGAFDTGMQNLRDLNLLDVLQEKVIKRGAPILGICLGMQLLSNGSEEGKIKGLGWIDSEVVRFNFAETGLKLKIPHMGWVYPTISKKSKLLTEIDSAPKFYFVHSYYLKSYNPEDILATASYGNDFVAAVEKDNIMGVQFHPEKSHKYGMRLLKNFIDLY